MITRRHTLIALGLVFLAIGAYALAGLGVPAFSSQMHMMPFNILKATPFTALYYMHTQPPLLNAMLAVTLIANEALGYPLHEGPLLRLMFLSINYALMVAAVAAVMAAFRALKLKPVFAIGLVLLFFANPAAVGFLHWSFYGYWVYSLSLILASFLLRGILEQKPRLAVYGVVTLGILGAFYSTYSLYILMALSLGVIIFLRPLSRRDYAIIAATVLIVAAPYVKNAYVFGQFSVSSWSTLSLAKVALITLPPEVLEQRMKDGRTSYAPREIVHPTEHIDKLTQEVCAERNFPCDEPAVSASGWNRVGYFKLFELLREDTLRVFREEPELYLRQARESARVVFMPAVEYVQAFYQEDTQSTYLLKRIHPLTDPPGISLYSPAIVGTYILLLSYGVLLLLPRERPRLRVFLPAALMLLFCIFERKMRVKWGWGWTAVTTGYAFYFTLLFSVYIALSARLAALRLWKGVSPAPAQVLAVLLLGLAFYLLFLTTLIEIGENMRYRMGVDALVWPLALLWAREAQPCAARLCAALRAKWPSSGTLPAGEAR